MRYRVIHTTHYRYSRPVSAWFGEHHLLLRDTPSQDVLETSLEVDPTPDELRDRIDVHGNRAGFVALHRTHRRLRLTASSLVDVRAQELPADDPPWEQVRDAVAAATDMAGVEARGLVLDSPQVAAGDELRELATASFTPGRPVVEALADLTTRVNTDFTFDPTATTVTTPVEEVLAHRRGVCQDFAHLMIGALRSLALPARYVSGYLETDPPPGRPRLQGADASHAWLATYVPGHGWVDADPTNDVLVAERHVTVAWGRDYADVAPLKGVIYTSGPTDSLSVEVDVIRVDPLTGDPIDRTTPALAQQQQQQQQQ